MSRRPSQLQDASPEPTQPVPRGDHLARVITPRGLQAPPLADPDDSRSWLDVAVAVARAAVVVAVMVTAVVLRDGVGARRRRWRRWRWCGRRRDRRRSCVMVVVVMVAGHGRARRCRRARGSRCQRRSGRFLRSAGVGGGRAAARGESQHEGGSGSQHGESERHVRVLASVLPARDHGISAMTRSPAGSGSAPAPVAASRS
jgi:hypothetical protein